MNTSKREASISQLETFINVNKLKADTLLQTLGWSPEKTLKETCLRNKRNLEDIPSIASKHNVPLEPRTLRAVLGNTYCDPSDDICMDKLTSQQKLAIYEYCIKQTGNLSEPEITIKFDSEKSGTEKEMTFAEIVARRRNLKRRTTRYRTGVSQSYVGELKNLIEIQMSSLLQYIEDNSKNEETTNETEKRLRTSRERHSPSQHYHGRKSSHKHKKCYDKTRTYN